MTDTVEKKFGGAVLCSKHYFMTGPNTPCPYCQLDAKDKELERFNRWPNIDALRQSAIDLADDNDRLDKELAACREALDAYKIMMSGEVKSLCDKIVNSPPSTTIKGDIESAAFILAHHPFVLNINTAEDK